MPDKFEYDVFISYAREDKDWVHGELLTGIEKAGLKPYIDIHDFKPGPPTINEMERGIQSSRKTILVLTPNYIKSDWCQLECDIAQSLDPVNRGSRLIPLLKERCDKPAHIAILTYIKFTDDADLEISWRQLLTALGKPPEMEAPKEPERDSWFLAHPYPMPPNFTGRNAERDMLTRWLDDDSGHPMLVLHALGGFGKSALVWHWLMHDVPPSKQPRVVWWSFYEGDSSFDHFLAETLDYLSGGEIQADKISAKDAIKTLLQILHKPGTLLVLDGFERVLRAFGGMDAAYKGDEPGKIDHNDCDCVSPLAEVFLHNVALLPNLRSKVLLTTRLRPRVLEAKGGALLQGCREEELDQMQPDDAVNFFQAQGIRGTHTEIEQACERYGYHPLSLRLLAGLILADFEQPGDVAVANRLDVSGDLIQRQNHVLKVAYDTLTEPCRALLGSIACFRTPVEYKTLESLAETKATPSKWWKLIRKKQKDSPPSRLSVFACDLDSNLRELVVRGLLHHDKKDSRFDLHPIVRRYAYDRLAAPDRAAAHVRLRDYFAAVPPPDKVTRLEDLAPVIELYHHTVRAGQFDEAISLFYDRLHNVLYFQLGAYQLIIDLLRSLFPDGEDRPPRLKDKSDQAWTLNTLAAAYSLSGQPRRAVPLFEQQNAIQEKAGDKKNLAIGLGNVATQQLVIGALQPAEANLRRSIALCREIKNKYHEAVGHEELGRLLAYRGAYTESETELATALKMFEKRYHVQSQGIVWSYRSLRELLRLRSNPDSALPTPQSALESAHRALELADEDARTDYPVERDYVRAHWLLGVAYRAAGRTDEDRATPARGIGTLPPH